MSVGEHCQRNPVTIRRDLTIREVAKQMEQQDAGCVVAVDDDQRPVGILTDRDITIRVLRLGLDPDETQAGDVMESGVETVRENTGLTTAMRRMRADAVRRLPVVDEEGRLVGVFHWSAALGIVSNELCQAAQVAAAQTQS
jgi:CBS domain-containing protein